MSEIPSHLATALADRYTLQRELGRGGMATVYLAHDVRHDRKVALKVLRPELSAILGADRFLAEIKTTANLQHPHILPLHDSGEADGIVFYVMPYVEGETLRAKLNRETVGFSLPFKPPGVRPGQLHSPSEGRSPSQTPFPRRERQPPRRDSRTWRRG